MGFSVIGRFCRQNICVALSGRNAALSITEQIWRNWITEKYAPTCKTEQTPTLCKRKPKSRRRKSFCIRRRWKPYRRNRRTGAFMTWLPLISRLLICPRVASLRRIKSATYSFRVIVASEKRVIRGRRWSLSWCRRISNGQSSNSF